MRAVTLMSAAALVLASGGWLLADDAVESGIPVGEKVGAYSTTKIAGCEDGVKTGQSLCYT